MADDEPRTPATGDFSGIFIGIAIGSILPMVLWHYSQRRQTPPPKKPHSETTANSSKRNYTQEDREPALRDQRHERMARDLRREMSDGPRKVPLKDLRREISDAPPQKAGSAAAPTTSSRRTIEPGAVFAEYPYLYRLARASESAGQGLTVGLQARQAASQPVMERSTSAVYKGLPEMDRHFMHLSTADQVAGTASRYFAGVSDLLLLKWKTERIEDSGLFVRFEDAAPAAGVAPRNGAFPHVCKPLQRDMLLEHRMTCVAMFLSMARLSHACDTDHCVCLYCACSRARADKPAEFKADNRPPSLSYWCLAACYPLALRDGKHVFPPEAFEAVAAEEELLALPGE